MKMGLFLVLVLVISVSAAEARTQPQQRYSKIFGNLGLLCKCCDGSNGECTVTQSARKLGAPSPSPSPSSSDSGHSAETDDHSNKEKMHSPTTSVDEEAAALLESKSGSDHRRPFDKSVAGGGVILGGLATTFLVAIFCYIRATRRHSKAESPTHQLP